MYPLRQPQTDPQWQNQNGQTIVRCHACSCYGTLNPDYGYSEERKAEILRAYHERSSLRGLERTFGVALCRRTRQVVSWFAGDWSADSCRKLWTGIPEAYRAAHTYSDFWQAYQAVFGENHRSVGKETGHTAHVERWNNTATLGPVCTRIVGVFQK